MDPNTPPEKTKRAKLKVPERVIKEILSRHRKGEVQARIAESVGLSQTTISRVIIKHRFDR